MLNLLDDPEVEAVVLAFPTQYRTEVALRAFERGKHVLLEKPIAMNVDEVNQLIAARGALVSGCCSSRNRFNKAARLVTELITSGGLGELRTVHCRALQRMWERTQFTKTCMATDKSTQWRRNLGKLGML